MVDAVPARRTGTAIARSVEIIDPLLKAARDACYAHKSQDPAGFYEHHDKMNRFRGLESGHKFAEAFVRHVQSRSSFSF